MTDDTKEYQMTDHNLTDDDLRKARKWLSTVLERTGSSDGAHALAIALAHVPNPGPVWQGNLKYRWATYTGPWINERYDDGPVLIIEEDARGSRVLTTTVSESGLSQYKKINLNHLTPRPDLEPVDLTPRQIEQETAPRTVTTTVEEYAALPEGSIVVEPEGGAFTLMGEGWHDPLGYGPRTHDRMAGTTRVLLREGWGE